MALAGGETLLAFKAGRAFRREGSNVVEPSPVKGAIYLTNGEDGLLHFIWKDRVTNDIQEDLILFPFDASFVKVDQVSSGRVYVLKFSSSNQRHFFWLQDASASRDSEFIENLNGLLRDPDYDLRWTVPIGVTAPGQSTLSQPTASTSTARQGSSGLQATPEQIAMLTEMLTSMSGGPQATEEPDLSLSDILTPANLLPLFSNHPELVAPLFPHLPPDLPVAPSVDALQRIIHSPQFRSAVTNFDQALRTGMLGGLVRTLGLPEEAGTGIGPFLRAVQEQAEREGSPESGDTMDTD
jgi:hypothetical protein